MLSHLSIKHLTLVDTLDLDFSTGMSVLTGETGAGKSILLGALGLAIGDRADSSLVSSGQERAEVSATFELSDADNEARLWLQDRALDDSDVCILRRVVSADGRSRAFVNGSAVNIGDLKTLGSKLINIHSQHEHQSLLKKETHRRLLDEYGDLHLQVIALNELFDQYLDTETRLSSLISSRDEQDARVQLLTYQFEELSELAVASGETEILESELKHLAGAETNQQRISQALELCSGDTDDNASDLLGRALTILAGIEEESIAPVREMLSTAQIQLQEAAADLSSIRDRFEADPARQQEVEQRLSRIYEVARKHKVEADTLPQLTEDIAAQLQDIENTHEQIVTLESDLSKLAEAYLAEAEQLTSARKEAGAALEAEVTQHLQDLGMNGARFVISIDALADQVPRRAGLDDIEFLVATIPGTAPGSLSKIASGGELSRISLAIQVVTAQTSDTPTLVFDEVDVGVGGATAEVVGGLLRKLGKETQVFCVTHLAQVAAQGHQHYMVTKSTTDVSASTTVVALDEEAKVAEIARMLGGVEQTAESLAHAESMLANSDQA